MIDSINENILFQKVETIKRKYCKAPRAPVKYNFRDLRNYYNVRNSIHLYNALMATSQDWRKDIFSALVDVECKVIVSCMQTHESTKRNIVQRREELTRWLFTNFLMRCGLEMHEKRQSDAALQCQVVLDWPETGSPRPFNLEYTHAYHRGRSADGGYYTSGSLRSRGFKDSILFGTMEDTSMLQVADLVVGASRDFVQECLGLRANTLGLQLMQICKHRIRGYPSHIFNRGIIVSNGNNGLRNAVRNAIATHLPND
jgi:hypothetical protein